MNEEIKYHVDCSTMSFDEYRSAYRWFNATFGVSYNDEPTSQCFDTLWTVDKKPQSISGFPKGCVVTRLP